MNLLSSSGQDPIQGREITSERSERSFSEISSFIHFLYLLPAPELLLISSSHCERGNAVDRSTQPRNTTHLNVTANRNKRYFFYLMYLFILYFEYSSLVKTDNFKDLMCHF